MVAEDDMGEFDEENLSCVNPLQLLNTLNAGGTSKVLYLIVYICFFFFLNNCIECFLFSLHFHFIIKILFYF